MSWPGGPFEVPEDLRRVLDGIGYLEDWRTAYRVQSVQASLHANEDHLHRLRDPRLRPPRAAVRRRQAPPARHSPPRSGVGRGGRPLRRAALERRRQGRLASRSRTTPVSATATRSSPTSTAIAASYAQTYLKMGFEPLYFGVTTLEEAAPDVDWRYSTGRAQHPVRTDPAELRLLFHDGPMTASASPTDDHPVFATSPTSGRHAPRGRRPSPRSPSTRAGPGRGGSATASSLVAVERMTSRLRDQLGIRRGDRVAILAPNRLEVPALLLATMRLGAAVVPLNPTTGPADWDYILGHSERARALRRPGAARPGRKPPAIVCAFEDEPAPGAAGDDVEAVTARRHLARGHDGVVLYTSGTTATPRGSRSRRGACSRTPGAWRSTSGSRGDPVRGAAALPCPRVRLRAHDRADDGRPPACSPSASIRSPGPRSCAPSRSP